MSENYYRISSNKHWVLIKRFPLINIAPLGIHIEIGAPF